MKKYTKNILLNDHLRKSINDQNVGRVIRYYTFSTNSHMYANFSHCLKPINDQRNMTKFWLCYNIL